MIYTLYITYRYIIYIQNICDNLTYPTFPLRLYKSHFYCILLCQHAIHLKGSCCILIIICGPVNRSQVPKYLVGTIYAGFC